MVERKVIKHSFFWNAVNSYGSQGLQFIIGIVMARLLMPADYGIIGMLTIFICISNALISAGFPTALLRKKELTATDLSTVFYTNILISMVMYGIMYVGAPYIAEFYRIPLLTTVTRVICLTFIINSVCAVSGTILTHQLKFKTRAIIQLATQLSTGIVAIYLAYNGLGVWALVWQQIVSAALSGILWFIAARWTPSLIFSTTSLHELFGFGSKILASNIITQIYQNIYSVVIGRAYNATDLGYFTRADGYSKLVPISFAGLIQNTLFPIISKIQDDINKLREFNTKMIKVSSFLIFPCSMVLAGAAYPTISVMISDKWLPTAPILQILCFTVLPEHLYYINNDFITVTGRSDYLMREQYISKTMSIVLLFAALPFGLMTVAVSKGAGALVTYLYSAHYLRKTVGINVLQQLKWLLPTFIISLALAAGVALAFMYLDYTLINLVVVLATAAIIYILAARIWLNDSLQTILNLRK